MKIITPGYVYELVNGTTLEFVRKEGDRVVPGTTNEELLEALINRTNHLNGILHCDENDVALYHMKAALDSFNSRTAARIQQGVETTDAPHNSLVVRAVVHAMAGK